jgi:hypothetical protein
MRGAYNDEREDRKSCALECLRSFGDVQKLIVH